MTPHSTVVSPPGLTSFASTGDANRDSVIQMLYNLLATPGDIQPWTAAVQLELAVFSRHLAGSSNSHSDHARISSAPHEAASQHAAAAAAAAGASAEAGSAVVETRGQVDEGHAESLQTEGPDDGMNVYDRSVYRLRMMLTPGEFAHMPALREMILDGSIPPASLVGQL